MPDTNTNASKPTKLKFFVPVALFAILLGFFLAGLNLNPGQIDSPFIGKPAPAFDLPKLLKPEERISRNDLVGQYTLLNVWGTWCPGCRQEHDSLLIIAENYNVPLYGLNWKDDSDKAQQWLSQLGNPYAANGFDPDGIVAIDWGVYGAPETFLISPDGTVLHKLIGPMDLSIWRNEFLPLIPEASR